jgi:hypothetical protein
VRVGLGGASRLTVVVVVVVVVWGAGAQVIEERPLSLVYMYARHAQVMEELAAVDEGHDQAQRQPSLPPPTPAHAHAHAHAHGAYDQWPGMRARATLRVRDSPKAVSGRRLEPSRTVSHPADRAARVHAAGLPPGLLGGRASGSLAAGAARLPSSQTGLRDSAPPSPRLRSAAGFRLPSSQGYPLSFRPSALNQPHLIPTHSLTALHARGSWARRRATWKA